MKLLIILALMGFNATAADDMQKWQASMQTLSATLVDAFPFLYSSTEFKDKKNQKDILRHLEKLASTTHMLPAKSGEVLIGAEPLIESSQLDMKTQLRSAIDLFKQGKHEAAQKLVHGSVQRCFACHTAYQIGPQYPTTNKEVMAMATPFTMGKAVVFGALRQFDGALELIEKSAATEELVKLYLVVAVRAGQNFPRAIAFLEKLGKSSPTNENYRRWSDDVKAWQEFSKQGEPADKINAYIEKQKSAAGSAGDKLFVTHLLESFVLHKQIAGKAGTPQAKKEIFAKLGGAYQKLGFPPLSDLAEIYLRKAK